MGRRRSVMAAGALVLCVAAVPGCSTDAVDCPPQALPPDHAIAAPPLPLPQPLPLDLSRIDVRTVGTHYEGPVRFIADVLRGDWARAEGYWAALAAIEDPAERMRQAYRLKFMLQGRGLYFLHAAQAWRQADPASPAAQLLLGIALADAATQARGHAYASQVATVQMARFKQRFEAARPHLEAIAARGDVHATLAQAFLQLPYFYDGQDDKGWATIEALIAQAPQYGWLYFWAAEYAKPKWAGGRGPQRLRRLASLATQHGLNATDRKVLEQEIAYVERDLEHQPDPQAWRAYWQKRQAEAPHLYNLLRWLGQEYDAQNWRAVEELASQALALNPHQTYSLSVRSEARRQLGRGSEAFADTMAAAVLGNDRAMQRVILAHVQGTLGVAAGDRAALLAHCRVGAAFGLPSAANCVGSMYVDGSGGLPGDAAQGVAWHLLAARGGHANSQHDVGVLLPRVAGQAARPVADFWMHEAARQGHDYARRQLRASGAAEAPAAPACEDPPADWMRMALRLLGQILMR